MIDTKIINFHGNSEESIGTHPCSAVLFQQLPRSNRLLIWLENRGKQDL